MGHEDMEDHTYYFKKINLKLLSPNEKYYSISFSTTIIQKKLYKNLNLNIPESKNKHQDPL